MSSEKNSNTGFFVSIIVLNFVVIALLVAQFFLLPFVIKTSLLEHEYEKVGSAEAYKTITELQAVYLNHPDNPNNIQAQEAILKQLKGSSTTTNSATANSTTLTDEQRQNILSNAVVEGNLETAEVVMVEYSDMECPFCVKQQNENKIADRLVEEFGDKVAIIFKNHRGVNHRGTEAKALGLLCANKVGGTDAYKKFYKSIFKYSETDEGYYPVEDLAKLATEIGLDVSAWQSCVDSKEMLNVFEAQTNEALSFGLNGTPSTILFNAKNGNYTKLEGAHPYNNFQSAVNALMAQ